tara:strand:+ start:712 stop:882 length:171 start_codon:yes stop_codon:yes gene_type:complete
MMKRWPEGYLKNERVFCYLEEERFNAHPTEENRMLALNARVRFENMWYNKKQLDMF